MKIGIIVYSQTGNTYSVAQKLKERLSAAKHSVGLERLKLVGEFKPGLKEYRFEALPDTAKYDALVLGSPVLGFSLSPVMKSYLAQRAAFKNTKVAFLVTEFFPFPWMGGNQAVGTMRRICESKGASVCGSGIVNWSSKRRNQQITEVVDRLSGLF
jgi:flavodoxin